MDVLLGVGDPDLGRVWAHHLADLGVRVTEATGEAEAIRALRRRSFAVLLLDLGLPGGGALAVASYAALFRPEARAVFVTRAHPLADGRIFALAANARAVLNADAPPGDIALVVAHHAAAFR